MGRRGLLHKLKFQVLVILVLCFQLLGSQRMSLITHVNGEGVPTITIASPNSGGQYKEASLTISGTVVNFPTATLIDLYDGPDKKWTINEILDNNWSIDVSLADGEHTITAKAEVEGVPISSDPVNVTIDTTLPVLKVESPQTGEYTNSRSIVGTTDPLVMVNLCLDCNEDTNGNVTGTWISVQADSSGKWEYEFPELTEGTHKVYAKAIDKTGNTGDVSQVNFTLDTLRPIILPDIFPKQNNTQVPVNTIIKAKVSEVTALNESVELINKSIKITQDGTNVEGLLEYNNETKEIIFTPSQSLLMSTKYNVFVDPTGIVDLAGNSAYPRTWSFTTVSNLSAEHQNPHGSYANNVNTCGNCHSTHKAEDSNLLSAKQNTETGQQKEAVAVDTYCMACHDGTVAPKAENNQTSHPHLAAVGFDGKPNGSSCSTCHNPHSDWTTDNPNLLQGDITYTHNTTPHPDKPTGEISSKLQLCESCHETDSAERLSKPGVKNRLFQYKNWNTATGIYEDFQLCLRCHNADFQKKAANTTDIAKYYDNLTEATKLDYEKTNGQSTYANREITAQEKSFSGHIIKAQDGSPLAGHIPCAECHDTHGSDNVYQLKTQIGHENQQTYKLSSLDSNATEKWDAQRQQEFCVTCHNGSTAIYGIVGNAIYDESGKTLNSAIPDHNKTITETTKKCSECHSNSKSFIEAAHAPKK
jgi:hypothetical protein